MMSTLERKQLITEKAMENLQQTVNAACSEMDRLRSTNAEMLEVLKQIIACVQATIQKAEGRVHESTFS